MTSQHTPGRPTPGQAPTSQGAEQPADVVIAIGSNIPDRLHHLQLAIDHLAATPGVQITAASPVMCTEPVGGPSQDDFYNAIVLIRTTLAPAQLLAVAHAAETAANRVRTERWGPRTLDVDIISWAGVRSADPGLTLPHPRAHQRGFVCLPWAQLDPDATFTPHGQTEERSVAELADQAPDSASIRPVADRLVVPS